MSEDYWEHISVQIAQEIRQWSDEVLEHPCETFANLPPCPYARSAWTDNRVMIHVTQDLEAVTEIKAFFPPTEDLLHIVAWTDYDNLTPRQFDEWIEKNNEQHFGVWLMGFHPDSDEDALTPEFSGLIEDDYALILVQSLGHLVRASDALRKTDYYSKFPARDMQYIQRRKEVFDAWNEKVDEEAHASKEEGCLEARLNGKEKIH